MLNSRFWITTGAVLGGVGVALGAFGAHGLAERLAGFGYDASEVARRSDIFETAVRYQMYHAPLLILIGLLAPRSCTKLLRTAGIAFLTGMLIFSGLLYVLVFAGSDWRWLGAIVPIGGVSLIFGWVCLALTGRHTDKCPVDGGN